MRLSRSVDVPAGATDAASGCGTTTSSRPTGTSGSWRCPPMVAAPGPSSRSSTRPAPRSARPTTTPTPTAAWPTTAGRSTGSPATRRLAARLRRPHVLRRPDRAGPAPLRHRRGLPRAGLVRRRPVRHDRRRDGVQRRRRGGQRLDHRGGLVHLDHRRGWKLDSGSSTRNHYYMAEWRNLDFDEGLKYPPTTAPMPPLTPWPRARGRCRR